MTINADKVKETIGKYMLADGFDIIFDLKKSAGAYVVDARDGKKYLDFFSFFATMPVGINHPKMLTKEFLEKLAYAAVNKPSNSDIYCIEMAEFIDSFFKFAIPPSFKHLFLIEGGALGIENALKTAFDWKIRKNFLKGYKEERGKQVIHFENAFHGRTGYTLSLTNTEDPRKTKLFPKFNWPRISNPRIRFPLDEENLKKTIDAEKKAIDEIKKACKDNKDDIAALIIEPIQGEGGDNHYRKEFFVALRQLADENDFIFIVDEVQAGFGLTGKIWCFEHYGITPDMFAFGKKTQVCGFVSTNRVDEIENNVFVESSRLNSTWGGNLIDMVRCQKYIEIMIEEKLVENAAKMGKLFMPELEQLEKDFPKHVTATRGKGLMVAFDLPDPNTRSKFLSKLLENGMFALPCGKSTVRFRPPLIVTEKEIKEGVELLRKSIKETCC
jgi:L-lysine 6-transaminase